MDKNALRELLAQKVQEKVEAGYEVRTYAADVGEPDRVKKALVAAPALSKSKKDEADAYQLYLESVKNGTYTPIKEDVDYQEGYKPRDRKREAKGSLTVQSRSTGQTSLLGEPARKPAEPNRKPNIRLDDLAQFR